MAGCFFSATSFSGVVAVSVDRFLAVHFHLRYQELVTHKRVVIVVIARHSGFYCFSQCSFWLYYHICGVHQDISNYPTAQESDLFLTSTRGSSV